MNRLILMVLLGASWLCAMEPRHVHELDNDQNQLLSALETVGMLYGDKEFKIKKYSDQKKLYARCIGSWLMQTGGGLNKPFEEQIKQAGINEEWFCQCLQTHKSKDKTITGNELVTLLWKKYYHKK